MIALTPDGARYWRMSGGERVCRPFHLRWLVPAMLGQRLRAWAAFTLAMFPVCVLLTMVLARQLGAGWPATFAAGALWAGLPSVRFALSRPVLVDLPTVAVALFAAISVTVHPVAGVVAALLAGTVNERAPIFAALFAWSPLPLVGLVPVAVRFLQRDGADCVTGPAALAVKHPVLSSRLHHRGHWLDWRLMLAPWGGCLLALAGMSWPLAVALVVAYAQLLVATDSVRLYQQVAPVVCIAAAMTCPPLLLPLLVVAHWLNPWAGNGV